MALFDEQLRYTPEPTRHERVTIGKVTLTRSQRVSLTIGFIIACVIMPIAVFLLTGFNFIFGGLAFVIADVLWELSHYYWTVIIPHKMMSQSLLGAAKQRIKDIETDIEDLENKYKFCLTADGPTEMTPKDIANIENEIYQLRIYHRFEKVWVEEKLTKYKQEELEALQKPVKEYEEKKLFFAEFKERLEMYISVHKLTCLKVVLDSVIELMQTLDKRPDGYELIPTMFYVYIDELQKIVAKICKREKEHMDTHMKDLTNVANALSQNINRMITKIHESEATEIDVGLTVLLKELGGEEADTDVER